jgi:hypothetical protein
VTVTDAKTDMWAKELVRLLNEMTRLHEELGRHMRSKLEAIRRADSDQIQSLTAREVTLANRVAEREGSSIWGWIPKPGSRSA